MKLKNKKQNQIRGNCDLLGKDELVGQTLFSNHKCIKTLVSWMKVSCTQIKFILMKKV